MHDGHAHANCALLTLSVACSLLRHLIRYAAILEELFGDAVVVADSRDSTSLFKARYTPSTPGGGSSGAVGGAGGGSGHEDSVKSLFADGSEFLLGVHLAKLHRREQLADEVRKFVESDAGSKHDFVQVRDALRRWYEHREDTTASRKLGAAAAELLEQRRGSLTPELARIYADKGLLAKPSKWIFGGLCSPLATALALAPTAHAQRAQHVSRCYFS